MEKLTKLFLVIIVIATILLSACSTPPPPVSKDQLETAKYEALEIEKKSDSLNKEKKALEIELSEREAELERLKEYKRQLESE
ncbi:MAG: hypothetical protein K8S23_16470 [Candidatus Cloacimonetes bacterium]|nr:hypothetical protein [Candidatus Cloacimonadota bacterium]